MLAKVSHEQHFAELRITFCQDFSCLLLRDTLDLLEQSSWCIGDRFNRIVPSINDQLNISFRKSCDTLHTH